MSLERSCEQTHHYLTVCKRPLCIPTWGLVQGAGLGAWSWCCGRDHVRMQACPVSRPHTAQDSLPPANICASNQELLLPCLLGKPS